MVLKPEQKKKSYKQYYHRQGPHSSKGADFDISETAKTADYNFNDTQFDTPFDRTKQKQNETPSTSGKQKKQCIYQEKCDNLSDKEGFENFTSY